MYTYVGKGTTILGIRNKPVECLQPGDRVLGYYVGVGTKCHTDSLVESVEYIGEASCKFVGSRSDFALIADGQKTIDPTFKYVEIDNIVYSVSRTVPRPFKVHETVKTDVYQVILKDSDVVPLLSSYMFVAFSEQPINFQGGLSGKENSERQSRRQSRDLRKQRKQDREKKKKEETKQNQRQRQASRKSRRKPRD